MKNKSKLKNEVVWTCDYCGEEFKTKKESDKHELKCEKNPVNKNKKVEVFISTLVVFFFIYLFTYFIVDSYAQSNGFKGKSLNTPSQWFINEKKEQTIQENPKTELQNIKYNGKVISGTVVNKSDKPIFNSKVVLKISKDRTAWNVDEIHEFIVPYKIDPNQSINFSENYKTTKKDPWWTTLIQESHFYNGENIVTPTATPTVYIDPIIDCKFDSGECKGASIKVRNSQCSKTTCCQIGNSWIPYITVEKCKEAQNVYISNNRIIAPTYKPSNSSYTSGEVKISCSYHSGDYNFDYGMLTYDECKIKSDAYWASRKASLYTPTPSFTAPTIAPTPNISNLCNQAVSDWNSYATEFYATQYNNYSSSAEAVRALEIERQEFQNLLNSYGCNITLRLM